MRLVCGRGLTTGPGPAVLEAGQEAGRGAQPRYTVSALPAQTNMPTCTLTLVSLFAPSAALPTTYCSCNTVIFGRSGLCRPDLAPASSPEASQAFRDACSFKGQNFTDCSVKAFATPRLLRDASQIIFTELCASDIAHLRSLLRRDLEVSAKTLLISVRSPISGAFTPANDDPRYRDPQFGANDTWTLDEDTWVARPGGRLGVLQLKGTNLTRTRVPWAESQKNLIHLDLSINPVVRSIFHPATEASRSSLRELRHVVLSDNAFSEIPTKLFALPWLVTINMRRNQVTALPTSIGQLSSLTLLEIDYNVIRSIPSEIAALTVLDTLKLNYNNCTKGHEFAFQLPQLGRIFLAGNSVSAVPSAIGRLTNLRHLELQDNIVTHMASEIGLLSPSSMTGSIDLDNNLLKSIPSEIGRLTRMSRLRLSRNRLTELPSSMGSLTDLRTLILGGNRDLTALPREIGRLSKLCQLTVDDVALVATALSLTPTQQHHMCSASTTANEQTGNVTCRLAGGGCEDHGPWVLGEATVCTTRDAMRHRCTYR